MNIKSILLPGFAVALLSVAAITASVKQQLNPHFAEELRKEGIEEKEESGEANDYMQSKLVNQVTGVLNMADVQAARDQANAMRQSSSSKTLGSIPNLEWQAMGPNNIGGRTRAILCDRADSNLLYMGMVTGGFWRSTDGGNVWNQVAGNDSLERLSISSITQAANGDIYYGTGESFPGGSRLPGNGVYKSTDKGLTFSQLPSTSTTFNLTNSPWHYVNEMKAHPTDANKIYAATQGGLYVTTNAGTTWAPAVTGLGANLGVTDVEISSTGNTIVAASVDNILISTNGGSSYQLINDAAFGLPGKPGIGRVEIAISPSDENYIYAVMSTTAGTTKGVYRTTNNGTNWTTIGQGGTQLFNPLGDQGTYNIAFGVHPTDKDMVFLGGQLDLLRWTPATNWKAIAFANTSFQTGRYVHADMHDIIFNSSNVNLMYVGTDGGFFRTQDCTEPNPFFIEKNKDYVTAQCYGIAVNRLGHILFGMQDNGTAVLDGSYANSPKTSKEQGGGDGMPSAISYIDLYVRFVSSHNGVLRRATDGGISSSSFTSMFDLNIDKTVVTASPGDFNLWTTGDGSPDEGSLFSAPLVLEENLQKGKSVLMLGLRNNVWFTQDALATTPVWFPLVTATNAFFSYMALSGDGKVAYAGTSGGTLYRITGLDMYNKKYTYDFTNNLLVTGFAQGNQFSVVNIGSYGREIDGIDCSFTGDTLVFCVPNYGNTDYVFRSINALASTPVARNIVSIQGSGAINTRLPQMPVFSIKMLSEPNCYLVGTDLGVYGTDNGGNTWKELNNIIGNNDISTWHPRLTTTDIVVKQLLQEKNGITYAKDIIYSGTYGRGIFRSTSASQPVSTKNISRNVEKLNVYPNPVNDVVTIDYDANIGGQAVVLVTNLTGKVVTNNATKLSVGANSIKVDMSALTRGVYFVSVSSANGKGTAKVVKR